MEAPGVTVVEVATIPPALPTLDEILTQDRFVPLAVALERTALRDMIEDQNDFVLLAPIAAAFASSAVDTGIAYSNLMNDAPLLEAVMRYHIVVGPSTGRSWRTLNGASFDVERSSAGAIESVDGTEVLDSISVSNGTILVVPRLLLPTLEPVGVTRVLSGD